MQRHELVDGFPKDELVRLLLDSLQQLGFSKAAKALTVESSISLENDFVSTFKSGILNGQWEEVEAIVPKLGIQYDDQLKMVKFHIARQKYLEALESERLAEALSVLRNEIATLGMEEATLNQLTGLVIFAKADELRVQAEWDGASGNSRILLLQKLHEYIPSHVMVPSNRLNTLLMQAIKYQESQCVYHNPLSTKVSLFDDHVCSKHSIPWRSYQTLSDHKAEVYTVKYSHSGTMIASGSQDSSCVVWTAPDVNSAEFVKLRHWSVVHRPITNLEWSPDDSYILACAETKLICWHVANGTEKFRVSHHKDPIDSCYWAPDGKTCFSGSKDGTVVQMNLEGLKVRTFVTGRVNDIVVSKDSKRLIVATQDRLLNVYNISTTQLEQSVEAKHALMTMSLSEDGDSLLVVTSAMTTPYIGVHPSQEIFLYDIKSPRPQLMKRFAGLRQSRFALRACFGGVSSNLIIAGSEDHKVYIWQRDGDLVAKFGGHSGVVNSVSWNPLNPRMFVSASDDCTIRVWGSRENKPGSHTPNGAPQDLKNEEDVDEGPETL